jgi:hypothetical protein
MMILIMAAIIAQGEMYHRGRGYFLTLGSGIQDLHACSRQIIADSSTQMRNNGWQSLMKS